MSALFLPSSGVDPDVEGPGACTIVVDLIKNFFSKIMIKN